MNPITHITASTDFIYILDMLGIIACAFAGTLLAKHKGLDMFGCILVAMVNAIGGGSLRDSLLDRHPMFWMVDLNYLWVILSVSLLVQIFFHLSHHIEKLITRFDAIGLAAFTLIGLKIGLEASLAYPIAIIMGIITAIVGGLLRDIICNEIPLVLRQEIYITAGIIGAVVYLCLLKTDLATWVIDGICLFLIYSIRMLSVRQDWHLPNISIMFKKQ